MKGNSIKNKRLTILILPAMQPYPPNDGGKLCVFGFIDYLRHFHDIHILLQANENKEKNNVEELRLIWPEVNISSVDMFVLPCKLSFKRNMLSIPRRFLNKIWKLFQTKNVLETADPYDWYEIYRTTPFYPHPVKFIKKLITILSNTKFDIIQTELTGMLNLVHLFPTEAKKIFVQIENRSNVLYDYGFSNNIHKGYLDYIVKNTEFLENSYMAKYDAVFTLNESDRIRFQKNLLNVKVYNSPFGILEKDIKRENLKDYTSENLIFIGGENHYPNLDALEWFLTDIIILVKNRVFKNLYITGNWKENTIRRLSAMDKSVKFIGFVTDLDPYLKNSISIVPIRIGGGGIRTKILVAMAKGSPVITTSLAAVGICDAKNEELIIADTADEFASAIQLLLINNTKAIEMIKNGFELIFKNFSQSVVSERRNNYYHKLTNTNSSDMFDCEI